jgi:hypothetical protein
MEYLGLEMTPAQIHALVKHIDGDGDGLVTFEDFKKAFGDPNLTGEETAKAADEGEGGGVYVHEEIKIAPKQMQELHRVTSASTSEGLTQVPDHLLKNFKVKMQTHERFEEVWNSSGTMSRGTVSVWNPLLDTAMVSEACYWCVYLPRFIIPFLFFRRTVIVPAYVSVTTGLRPSQIQARIGASSPARWRSQTRAR